MNMDKEKLQLRHISPYLPYGLKAQTEDKEGEKIIAHVIGFHDNGHVSYEDKSEPDFDWIDIAVCYRMKDRVNGYFFAPIQNVMLLLHPLSDLVKPLPSGEIPLIEMAKFVDNGHNHTDSKIKKYGYSGDFTFTIFTERCDDVHAAKFIIIDNKLAGVKIDNDNVTATTLQRIFGYLFANHFDVFSLISAGLAVDVNSIEK